jgi:hypothetical protein
MRARFWHPAKPLTPSGRPMMRSRGLRLSCSCSSRRRLRECSDAETLRIRRSRSALGGCQFLALRADRQQLDPQCTSIRCTARRHPDFAVSRCSASRSSPSSTTDSPLPLNHLCKVGILRHHVSTHCSRCCKDCLAFKKPGTGADSAERIRKTPHRFVFPLRQTHQGLVSRGPPSRTNSQP